MHQCLGIPAEEQPPNHYRLLAVPLFEGDPNVIESAADRQMAHLRVFQAGKHGKLSPQHKRLTATLDEVYQAADATEPAAKKALAQKLLADGRGQAATPLAGAQAGTGGHARPFPPVPP